MRELEGHLTIECRDRSGQLLWKHRQKSKSYVIAYFRNQEAISINGDASGTCQDTTNNARIIRGSGAVAVHGQILAAAGVILYGIVVGTGVGAVAPTNYQLGAIITHGAGAGQLNYAACSVGGATTTPTTSQVTVTRAFTNSSGAPITVNEIGIYAWCADNTASSRYFCFVRDLVVPGRVINNLATATATYTLSATA
jgi:hypothetical protein